jgi:hypothetical protein
MNVEKMLYNLLKSAESNLEKRQVKNDKIYERLVYVCRCISNRACVRLLMACLVAKIDDPKVDPRKPYTEINTPDCFSGRSYDEAYLTHFIMANRLPCNITTAFLTPAFRSADQPITKKITLIGRPRQLYISTVQLLDDVYKNKASAKDLLIDTIRILIQLREEKQQRMQTLLSALRSGEDSLPLSSEQIVNLVLQHLNCMKSSRLPVLIVAAAYKVVGSCLGERVKTLKAHNAADLQTGALGDIEICLIDEKNVITAYEMKTNRVTIGDVDIALQKIVKFKEKIHNYIFVTTENIEPSVFEYTKKFYEQTGGTEITILDCIGFLRHFLHFFHRIRLNFLEMYQELVLAEPDSAVGQPLKEAFLALRHAAESGE